MAARARAGTAVPSAATRVHERLEIDGRLPPSSARRRPVRVGRGKSARRGRKCGRGDKGAGQRSRGWNKFGVMGGGQNPFYRMHPKVGFSRSRPRRKVLEAARLAVELAESGRLKPGKPVTLEDLRACGALSAREEARAREGRLQVKVLGAPVAVRGLELAEPIGASAGARGDVARPEPA